jgi:phenylacetate-CoA ligase
LFDIDRLWNINERELVRLQNKRFRELIKFAYDVPMYHEKYKKAGVYPGDIKTLDDINKLPIVTKNDLIIYYPEGLISKKVNKTNLVKVSTSGTTGKSVSIFVDIFEIILGLFLEIRSLKEHRISWRKDKLTIIADFAPHTVETGYIKKGIRPSFSPSLFFKNIQWLNTNDPPEVLIEEINKFKPDFIGGYVGMIGHLTLLKEKGFGKDINPRVIATTGAPLSKPLKNFILNTFNASIYESYASTESGLMAFQCKKGNFHVMSDFVHLEFLSNVGSFKSDEAGKIVVTKLFGRGTPIIRYDSINDIVAPLDKKCDCSMSGALIDRIYGRDDIAIYSPDGRILLPSSFGDIFGKVLYELRTNKLRNTRIIQHSLKKIEIQVVIDEKLRDVGPSIEEIFSVIQQGFREKIGEDITVVTKEVKEIDRSKPRIISNVDPEKFRTTYYD